MRSNNIFANLGRPLGLVLVLLACWSLALSTANAQLPTIPSDAKPKTVMLLVRSSAIASIRNAFDSMRSRLPKDRYNAQSLSWTDSSAIRAALELPNNITPESLKPFIAQHSAAIEDLRERMEPKLFHAAGVANSVAIDPSLSDLRATETRIARWFVLTYREGLEPRAVASMLKKSSSIELAEPKFIRKTCYTPNDPLYTQQYGPQLIKAPQAWDVVRCDTNMVIADVDVGTDWSHPDLAQSIFINWGEMGLDSNGLDKRSNGIDDDGNGFVDDWHGWDFGGVDGTNPDNNTICVAGHGTHTAGIMAATGNNGVGIAGVAFGAKLLPIKGADDNEALDYIWPGVVYAADMGARVVNCSWGGSSRAQAEQDVVNYVTAKGLGVIAASGNNGLYQEFFPASYQNVLSVGAVDNTSSVTGYSNRSTRLAVLAPGTGVLSTVPVNDYQQNTGTSMAAPHATASVALVLQRFPGFSSRQAMEQIRATAQPLTNDPFPGLDGHGIIDLFQAVSNTKAYSVRIDSVEIRDNSGRGFLSTGDDGHIVLHVKNWLTALNDLHAKIEILADPGSASTTTTDLRFGSAGTLQSLSNDPLLFPIHIGATTLDTTIIVKVTFYDTSGYPGDVDYFHFVVNQSFRDLNANNLTVTFDSRGSIGYANQQDNTEGSGVYWRNAPPSITPTGKNVVYASGLMIAQDTQHVVSSAPNSIVGRNDTDFSATTLISNLTPIEHFGATQELLSSYTDTLADPAVQVGVAVTERSYAFTKGLAANAAVVDYTLHKRQTRLGTWPSDSIAVALYADWDIGISGANNLEYFDSALSMSITKRLDPNYPYVGVALLSTLPNGASINFYADQNDGADGSVNTYAGISRIEKWMMMTTQRHAAGPKDVSMVYGLTNVPLFSLDSVHFTVAIMLATSDSLLRITLADTRRAWATLAVASSQLSKFEGLEAYPNPASRSLRVRWSSGSNGGTVTLYDLLGRVVLRQEVHTGNSAELLTGGLPVGSYQLEVVSAGIRHTRTIITSGTE